MRRLGIILLLPLWLACPRSEAVVLLAEETFDLPLKSAWSSRDADELVVSHETAFGNPEDSLKGVFAEQEDPFFEIDTFRLSDDGVYDKFTGDLYAKYTTFTRITFDFYAADVLPSTMLLRLTSGSTVFFTSFAPDVTGTGAWMPVSVDLAYAGWTGGTESEYNALFNDLDYIDVQLARSGTGEQTYYLDNFRLWDDELEIVAVPEPNYLGLLVIFAWLLGPFRRLGGRNQ